jgi:orotidine-5'-phosphate decarboxylase
MDEQSVAQSRLAALLAADPARVVVALDCQTSEQALALAAQLDPAQCKLKVGKELFTGAGPALIEQLQRLGFKIFLDLKFHDIPNTVGKAIGAAARLGVWMSNVHASGGLRMMEAAADAVARQRSEMLLIAVTVLTSMERDDLRGIGIDCEPAAQVALLANLTAQAGLHGVVCSAQEAPLLRRSQADNFVLVTPGIRPVGSASDDQRRIVSPRQALAQGSDYLVIGRPITQADQPAAALAAINASLQDRDEPG